MGHTVFDIIKSERLRKNLTQSFIAKKLKFSQSHYARIENGERELTFDVFVQLVEILEIEPNQILSTIYKKPIHDLNKSEMNLLALKKEIVEELENKLKK